MLARYSGSIGVAVLVTAALIYWMQLMIESGHSGVVAHPVLLAEVFAPRTVPRSIPHSPATVVVIENIPCPTRPPAVTAPDFPAIVRPVPVGPVTPPGPPSPPVRPDGRRGPWAADTDLMILSQIAPTYPFGNISRGLEGTVVVDGSPVDVPGVRRRIQFQLKD